MVKISNEISVEEYTALRRAVGWPVLRPQHAKAGLAGSFYIAVARDEDKAVGIARAISDGGYMALIADVMVHPDYQGKGIGKMIVQNVMNYLKNSVDDEDLLMINLMSAKGKDGFYRKLGFVERPNENDGAGFAIWVNRK